MRKRRILDPKAEAYVQGRKRPYKSRDMFAWYLQP